ncbi:MAG: hypothetical protein M1815_000086 [Lichina confinis]|nr:MAG: hypothetical protein M1815_000086 [Lichina confinis]
MVTRSYSGHETTVGQSQFNRIKKIVMSTFIYYILNRCARTVECDTPIKQVTQRANLDQMQMQRRSRFMAERQAEKIAIANRRTTRAGMASTPIRERVGG